MGNSFGAVDRYVDLAYREPLFQGGFIWDFADQAIALTDRYGREFFGYGGDCGEAPHDNEFCGNGILFADHTPTPRMQEVKYLYQGIKLDVSADSVTVTNRMLFTDTAALDTTAAITVNLNHVTSGNFPAAPITGTTVGVEAGQTVTLVITDGTTTVTVAAVVNPDGSYSTTADLSGLADGPLTVTAAVTDLAGNPAVDSDSGVKAIADVPILASIDDILILTPGSTVISTGGTDAVVIPGLGNSGAGVLQADLERELGVWRAARDREAVDEAVRTLHRQHVVVLRVLVVEQRRLAGPDDADVRIAVEECRLRTVGIEELDQRQPLLQHRTRLLERRRVGRGGEFGQGGGDDAVEFFHRDS